MFALQTPDVAEVAGAVDEVWLLVAAMLVMFMQAGFALVEAGFTQAKNAGNIIMKNFMDFSVGSITYWAFGFALAYGGSTLGGFVAYGDLFFFNDNSRASAWFFQVVFAATAATIVSGAIAGRVKFTSYLIYTPFITGLIYPIVTHWVWNPDGWLAKLGYFDFAGSGVVHLLGGACALAGVIVIGPRIGRFSRDGRSRQIPGHSITLGALGVFILWFGWYGFNAGSTLGMEDPATVGRVAMNTTLAAATAVLAAMFTSWVKFKKPDLSLALNGALAGLVAITAPCAVVGDGAAICIGLIAGVLVVFGIGWLNRLQIDDCVGAFPVHGLCGIWGTLAVGLFGQQALSAPSNGLFYGGGVGQLGIQCLGVIACLGFTAVAMWAIFKMIDALIGLRVSEETELKGLDLEEHGMVSYGGFQIFTTE